jgi:hypothetical protein
MLLAPLGAPQASKPAPQASKPATAPAWAKTLYDWLISLNDGEKQKVYKIFEKRRPMDKIYSLSHKEILQIMDEIQEQVGCYTPLIDEGKKL